MRTIILLMDSFGIGYAHDAENAGRLLCKEAVLPVPDLSAHGQVQVRPEDERGQPWFFYRTGAYCRLWTGEY